MSLETRRALAARIAVAIQAKSGLEAPAGGERGDISRGDCPAIAGSGPVAIAGMKFDWETRLSDLPSGLQRLRAIFETAK